MNTINWRLLIKVAKNHASQAEMEEFEKWLNESPEEHQAIFEEVKEIYHDQQKDPDMSAKTNAAFAKFLEHNTGRTVRSNISLQVDMPVTGRRFNLPAMRVAVAAACLILLSGITFLLKSEAISNYITHGSAVKELKWKELKVEYGKQVYLTLNDGSVIRLAPGSSLKYPEEFGAKERRVQLEGEAFFEVSKDPSKPFIVQAANLETRVLGTSFNIEAFKNQPLAKVTVVTGKVAVSKNIKGRQSELLAYLTPNKQIVFDERDDTFNVKNIAINMAKAIKDGKLIFDGSSMTEIALALERRYGIDVQFGDKKIADMHLTTTIDFMSIDSMSLILSMASGLDIQHKGNSLYISMRK